MDDARPCRATFTTKRRNPTSQKLTYIRHSRTDSFDFSYQNRSFYDRVRINRDWMDCVVDNLAGGLIFSVFECRCNASNDDATFCLSAGRHN